jgi:hypothetical protein
MKLQTRGEIKNWLVQHNIAGYTINQDVNKQLYRVDVDSNCKLYDVEINVLPVQFGRVEGDFYCNASELISLEGVPYYVGGTFYCSRTNIKSLSGIDKIVKYIGAEFFCTDLIPPPTHLLGLLLIGGIKRIKIDYDGPIDKIMNKYIGTGDILSAQDELIDVGLIDQARL